MSGRCGPGQELRARAKRPRQVLISETSRGLAGV